MILNYYVIDPTGNITALVTTPVEPALQPEAGRAIMAAEPLVEQVGFFAPGSGNAASLRMAGGEFCGNATMSAAVLRASGIGVPAGSTAEIPVSVSGVSQPVKAAVTPSADGSFAAKVKMPPPDSIKTVELMLGQKEMSLPAVFFGRMAHIISEVPIDRSEAEKAARGRCAAMECDCLGIMQLCGKKLIPLVFVPQADTLFWESSCASGTTAAGCYLASKQGGSGEFTFEEPGGSLCVSVKGGDIGLSGTVKILREGSVGF